MKIIDQSIGDHFAMYHGENPKSIRECGFCGSVVFRRVSKSGRYYCSTDCKAEWQKTQRPVEVDWLRQKYEVEKLDCAQIAALVNRDAKSVWNWLKASGITTRARGKTDNWKYVKNFKRGPLAEWQKQKLREDRLRDGRIPALINGVHWMKALGRRSGRLTHGLTPERQMFYSTAEWKRVSLFVWQRDNATCQRCRADFRECRDTVKFEVHHVDGFAVRERRSDSDNLILLCRPCHKWTHGKENTGRLLLGKGH